MRLNQFLGACTIALIAMSVARAEEGREKQQPAELPEPDPLVKIRELKIPFPKRELATTHDPAESVCLRLSSDGTRGAVAMVTKPSGANLVIPEMTVILFNLAQGRSISVPLAPKFPKDVLDSEPADRTICRRLQIEWSPDGSTLAVVECARGYLWLLNQDGIVFAELDLEKPRQDTENIGKNSVLSNLAWYPDGCTLLVIGFSGLYTIETSRRPLGKEERLLTMNDVRRFAAPSNLNPIKLSWGRSEKIPSANELPVYFWVPIAHLPGTGGAMSDEFQLNFMPKEKRCSGKPKPSVRSPMLDRTIASITGRYIARVFSKAWLENGERKEDLMFTLVKEKVRAESCPKSQSVVAVSDPRCKRILAMISGGIATHWSDAGERLAVFGISAEGFSIHSYRSPSEVVKPADGTGKSTDLKL